MLLIVHRSFSLLAHHHGKPKVVEAKMTHPENLRFGLRLRGLLFSRSEVKSKPSTTFERWWFTSGNTSTVLLHVHHGSTLTAEVQT